MVHGDSSWTVGHVVIAEIRALLEATGRRPKTLGEGDRLDDLGISSLDLADLVAALNQKLATSPFQQAVAFTDIRTVADLCRAYQPASSNDPNLTPLGELEETRRRALARRAASQG